MMVMAFIDINWEPMGQISARIPDEMVAALDAASSQQNRSRASVIRQALVQYLEEFSDISATLERLQNPSDPILDWNEIRRELHGLE